MSNSLIHNIQKNYKSEYRQVPQKTHLIEWLEDFLARLFPLEQKSDEQLQAQLKANQALFQKIVKNMQFAEDKVAHLSDLFYAKVNDLLDQLHLDADEFLDKDPAASCKGEVLHTYPGFHAIAIYRIAHILSKDLQLQYVPRMLTEIGHSRTGIDIHPNAQIDAPFFIDHGTGVVIGETCKIGKHVNLYQGVTLGALQVEKSMKGSKRHPTVEDYVVVYANATILGGNTVVGNHSVVGGNVFLTQSVDPYSIVYTKSEIRIKEIKSNKKPINFSI